MMRKVITNKNGMRVGKKQFYKATPISIKYLNEVLKEIGRIKKSQ
jgi:hypothetical protein